jgi:hypothetical protein
MTVEVWRPIVGYEGYYEVSDQGRVRSVDRLVAGPYGDKPWRLRGKPMKQTPWSKKGYLAVKLTRQGQQKRWSVHRLVLTAFVGPCPEGMEACHNNHVKSDNRLANLRWDTASANILDQVSAGVHNQARKTRCPQGHTYDAKNTYVAKGGGRSCRLCARDRARAAKVAKRAA